MYINQESYPDIVYILIKCPKILLILQDRRSIAIFHFCGICFDLDFDCVKIFSLKDAETKKVVEFILPSISSCKALWKNSVAHHTFYRLVLLFL